MHTVRANFVQLALFDWADEHKLTKIYRCNILCGCIWLDCWGSSPAERSNTTVEEITSFLNATTILICHSINCLPQQTSCLLGKGLNDPNCPPQQTRIFASLILTQLSSPVVSCDKTSLELTPTVPCNKPTVFASLIPP